ncbi:hypothetical protein H6G64_12795 [Calothrix sp. FACHB-156]|nr:hypothetical protein [Nostoc linckia FACHB-104]MBD2337851.1 hypothetical protein [Calothrix sp. FACHB-156]
MSGDENTHQEAAIELTDEELDEVAGGFNLRLTAARFHKSTIGFAQETPLGRRSSAKSAFQAETTESALLQITITDATTEDLKALGELFGDASALDGSA